MCVLIQQPRANLACGECTAHLLGNHVWKLQCSFFYGFLRDYRILPQTELRCSLQATGVRVGLASSGFIAARFSCSLSVALITMGYFKPIVIFTLGYSQLCGDLSDS